MTTRTRPEKYTLKDTDMSYKNPDFPFRRVKTLNPILAYLILHYDKNEPHKKISIEKMSRILGLEHMAVKYYIIHGAKTKPTKELCYELSAKLGISAKDLLSWRPDNFSLEERHLLRRPSKYIVKK